MAPAMMRWIAVLLVCAACEPLSDSMDFDREEVPWFAADEIVEVTPGETLKVMAWNMKYAGGRLNFFFDFYGDRVTMTEAEVEENLAGLAALINEMQPDVVMAQEIEVGAKRSAYVDMLQELLDRTHLNYGAYFQSWDSRFVPLEGLGRVNMGVAIMSVFPIDKAERIKQPARGDQDALGEIFYLHRMIGRAELIVGDQTVAVYSVHTEAFDQDGTKGRQIGQIHDLTSAETLPWVLGGDFNSLPPNAAKSTGFNDEPEDQAGSRFEAATYDLSEMQPLFDDFQPSLTTADYGDTEALQERYYTHTILPPDLVGTDGEAGFWNRTLDYLFIGSQGSWVAGRSDVLQKPGDSGVVSDPMLLSDHAPVIGTWRLP